VRRLRITFLLLGVLLLAPLSLLLARALQGIERERDARHELLASRVFDESERALGEFLRAEQSLSASDYLQPRAPGPSPFVDAPIDFVIGHFEIDREGRVAARSGESAALVAEIRAALPQLPPAEKAAADELDRFRSRAEPKRAKAVRELNKEQEPGTTRLVQKVDPLKGTEKLKDARLEAKQEEVDKSSDSDLTSYNTVMERLNLGKKRPSEAEPQTAALSSASAAASPPAAEPGLALAPDALPESSARADMQERKPDAERDFAGSSSPADAARGAGGRSAALGSVAQNDYGGVSGEVLVTSFDGIPRGERRLVLRRSVLRGGRTYEQGLLIDLPALTAWLESGVLGASGLSPYLELAFPSPGAPPAPLASDRFVYEHRFQEPFDSLSARLSVAPLPEESSAGYLYALGALLVLASTAGLWAVYRRVAAAVHFSERRSNFAAAVSHELKTPLTSIRMYAEMLRDGMAPDEATRRSYLDTITSESERLTRLINNVLEFSRLERRAQDPVLVSETPLPALRAALRALEPHARAQGFALREASAEPIPAALFDRDALQQILFNLIDNALKYARRAERKEIEVACSPCAGGVALRVRDFGPGVAREHEPHLFEPFYRGGDELTRQTQGTGIGLALVRELAQRMGAEVSAQNCSDGGFAVELRLRGA
jgi:signal transduction histidine kinase